MQSRSCILLIQGKIKIFTVVSQTYTDWLMSVRIEILTLASVTLNSLSVYSGMLYSAWGSTTKYWYLADRESGQYWWHFSLPISRSLVSITTIVELCSHIIRQKSSAVSAKEVENRRMNHTWLSLPFIRKPQRHMFYEWLYTSCCNNGGIEESNTLNMSNSIYSPSGPCVAM